MEIVALYLAVIFASGLLAVLLRLPPLVGFLAAGFVLNAIGAPELPWLDHVADLGVTLLLFGIGLKLDVRSLLAREVWLTAGTHLVLSLVTGTVFLWLLGLVGFSMLGGQSLETLVLLAFALSFSSTVLVIKILEWSSDSQSFFGRIAIGVLIMQDIAAVVFITVSRGAPPSPWAFALLLLPPLAWVLRRLWDLLPHGEMQGVFGLAMALVPGYAAFEAVGLKGDLGALLIGMMLAGHQAAGELSRMLFTVKDLLLVGFFVSVGLTGAVTGQAVAIGLLVLLLLPLQVLGYVWILHAQRLRRRTSVLAALALGNYSEFALIVAAVGVEAGMLSDRWLVALAVALAGSFLISSVVIRRSAGILTFARRHLKLHPPETVHPNERPIEVGDARAVVLGMGRIGRAAYEDFSAQYAISVLGVESSGERVRAMTEQGYAVVEADATDADFWSRLNLTSHVEIAVLAMPFHRTNLEALTQLHASGFTGVVAAVAQYDDEVTEIRAKGADVVIQIYEGVGVALAELAAETAADREG